MKRILIIIYFSVLFFAVSCDVNKIYEIERIGDSYLPNIHWQELIDNDFVEVDTLFIKSDDSSQLRLEIFYDNPEDYKEITIDYLFEVRPIVGGYSFSTSLIYRTDMTLDSLSDKILIVKEVTAREHNLFAYDAIIYEPEYPDYDLLRYKTIYIANPDSF